LLVDLCRGATVSAEASINGKIHVETWDFCIDKGRKSMKINGKTIQDGEQQQKMLVCTKWIKGNFSHV
jgi:hypothetical protein